MGRIKIVLCLILGMAAFLCSAGCEMKTVYLVEVEDSKNPVFPDSCIVCGTQKQERLTSMTMCDEHGRMDFSLYKLSNINAVGSLLEIPAHDTCLINLRNDLLKRFTLILLGVLSLAAIGFFSRYGTGYFIVAAIVLATPFLYLEFTTPVPVEFYRHDRAYFMLFKDEDYAKAFARLNNARVKETQYPYFGTAD